MGRSYILSHPQEKFPLPCDINRCDDIAAIIIIKKDMCIYSIFITEASGYFNGGNKRAMKVLTI